MIKVKVTKQSHFPVSSKAIKDQVSKTLKECGLVSNFEVVVALVGEKKMDELVKKYYKREGPDFGNRPHPILTFPNNEVKEKFIYPPMDVTPLGEMAISYPQAVTEANKTGKRVEEIILSLVAHGCLHLAGVHH